MSRAACIPIEAKSSLKEFIGRGRA